MIYINVHFSCFYIIQIYIFIIQIAYPHILCFYLLEKIYGTYKTEFGRFYGYGGCFTICFVVLLQNVRCRNFNCFVFCPCNGYCTG